MNEVVNWIMFGQLATVLMCCIDMLIILYTDKPVVFNKRRIAIILCYMLIGAIIGPVMFAVCVGRIIVYGIQD